MIAQLASEVERTSNDLRETYFQRTLFIAIGAAFGLVGIEQRSAVAMGTAVLMSALFVYWQLVEVPAKEVHYMVSRANFMKAVWANRLPTITE